MSKAKTTKKHHKPRNSKFQSIHEGSVTSTHTDKPHHAGTVLFHSRMSFYVGMFFGMIVVQVLFLSVLMILSS